MLNYYYKCHNCGADIDVTEMGSEVYIDPDYDHSFEKHEDIKCPKCGAEFDKLECTWGPNNENLEMILSENTDE